MSARLRARREELESAATIRRPLSSARVAATALLAALVLSPLARGRGYDSFPLSTFPMFSRGDLGTRVWIDHALLVDAQGERRPAPPALVGTPEPMVAKALVERAVASGTAAELCARIAARAPEDAPDARSVEIVSSEFDSRRYFEDAAGRTPLQRRTHASCSVRVER